MKPDISHRSQTLHKNLEKKVSCHKIRYLTHTQLNVPSRKKQCQNSNEAEIVLGTP